MMLLIHSLLLFLQVLGKVDFSNHFIYEIENPCQKSLDLLHVLGNDNILDFWGFTSTKSILISLPLRNLEIIVKTGLILHKAHSRSLQDLIDDQIILGHGISKTFHEKYHNLVEIYEFLDFLLDTYPHLTSSISIGKSFEKRDIGGIRIKNINSTSSSRFVIHAGIHAREWIGPATIMWITETLLKGYSQDPIITKLLDSHVIEIIPVLNVDGYAYTHSTNRMWR